MSEEDKTQGRQEAGEQQEEPTAEAPAEEQPAAAEEPTAAAEESPAEEAPAAGEPTAAAEEDLEEDAEEDEEPTPRVKPLIPGADLEVDIVREGEEALRGENLYGEYDEDTAPEADGEEDLSQPIADASIDLAAGARYTATGKRKTAVARVILKPGDGTYAINGKPLELETH